MAQLDRTGLCGLAEYTQAFETRLHTSDLNDAEILTMYLRLERLGEAVKLPVQIKTVERNVAGLAIDVTLVDDDLRPVQDAEVCRGIMSQGIWNPPIKTDGFYWEDVHNRPVYTYNGVFLRDDFGLDMSEFENELVGTGAGASFDFSSFKL